MATDNKEVAMRKRQQIDSSKKTMFIFVASAAFLAGIALVVSIFLVQQIVFHSKILLEKQNTISRLGHPDRRHKQKPQYPSYMSAYS